MSRIKMMTSATAALLMTASALAWSWEVGSRLTLVTSNGERIVGVGQVEDGRLTLTLESEFEGIAVLVVERADGRLETVDVLVESDGRIMLGEEGEFSELEQSLVATGLDLTVGRQPVTAEGDLTTGADADASEGRPSGTVTNVDEPVADDAARGLEVARERAKGPEGKRGGADVDVDDAGGGADVGLGVGVGGRTGNGRDR